MSVTNKSIVFLFLTFAVSWGIVVGGWALGAASTPLGAFAALLGMMTGPAIAAVICAFAFENGRRMDALGLHFKPNWWWLFAYLIPIALSALSVVATVLLSDRSFGDMQSGALAAAAQAGQDISQLRDLPLVPLMFVQALVLGAVFNSFALTFTEELGWRGYLYGLWRPSGFWRTSLATGVIWGVWHAPAIFFFGLNYPTERVLGIGLFILYCTLLSPIVTLVRERGGSTWAAGIMHGTFNAAAGLTMLALSDATYPWNGIVGIGGFVALAIGVGVTLVLQRKTAPQLAAA